jgi:hypothetical protein
MLYKVKTKILNSIIFPVYHYVMIRPTQMKMKKATLKEYEALQSALKSNNVEEIAKAGANWNLALARFHQQHFEA